MKILTLCGIIIFAFGVLNLQNFCDHTQNREKIFYSCDFPLRNSVLRTFIWLTESSFFIFLFLFCVWPPLWGGGGFIHFGAPINPWGRAPKKI